MASNITRGHDGERFYARVFQSLGFPKCKTSRLGSRLMDNCKVDLMNIPYNIQIKAGTHKGLKAYTILNEMVELLKNNFETSDPVQNHPKFLIHRRMIYSKSADNDLIYFLQEDYEHFVNKGFYADCIVRPIHSKKHLQGLLYITTFGELKKYLTNK